MSCCDFNIANGDSLKLFDYIFKEADSRFCWTKDRALAIVKTFVYDDILNSRLLLFINEFYKSLSYKDKKFIVFNFLSPVTFARAYFSAVLEHGGEL